MKILHGLFLITLLAIAGCGTPPGALFSETVEQVPAVTNGNEVIPAHSVTNYAARPEITGVAKGIGVFVPQPWGGIASGVIMGVLGVWGALATKKKNRWAQVAGVLVSNVDTGRAILKQVPGGADLDAKYVAKIADSQTAHGVRADVQKLLAAP